MTDFMPVFIHQIVAQQDALLALTQFKPGDTLMGYAYWLRDFQARSALFYRRQFHRHSEYLFVQFARKCHLDPQIPLTDYGSDDYALAFKQYYTDNGLLEHRRDKDSMIKSLSSIDGGIRIKPSVDDFIGTRVSDVQDALWELWFNQLHESVGEIKRLCALTYPDYLRTPHWLRVRAAMLIAHNASCQSLDCESEDRGWGFEYHFHVHHLTYANRGHERFAELRLLCDQHHQELHERGAAAAGVV